MKRLLLETIRCEAGRLQNLEWHQARVGRSSLTVHKAKCAVDLGSIRVPLHAQSTEGLFKCRVLYDTRIHKTEFTPYSIRPVKTLKLAQADGLKYDHKYADRSKIQALFEKRGGADDILFVINGLVTDTSYANIALFDGTHWVTPAAPLLPGTRRAALLAEGKLQLADIPPHRLSEFSEIRLINAMINLEESPVILPGSLIHSFTG